MSAFPSSAVLLCLLLAAMSRSILGQCPTRPVNAKGESESNADSEEAKECDVYTIIQCSSNSSTSTSSMTSTSSPSSTSTGSTSTGSSASTTNSSDTTSSATSSTSTASSASTSSASSAATTSAYSEPCPCTLINELNNMKKNFNSSEQIIFNVYIDQIRVVLIDVTFSVKEKVSRIGVIIQSCFDTYVEIKNAIKYNKIDKWGRLHEVLAAGISFDSANVDAVIASDSTGNSTLTTALLSGTANDACGTGTGATVQAFVGKMKLTLRKTMAFYGKERKMAHIYKTVNFGLYANNSSPSFKQCLESINIPGFGSFGRFMRVCSQYQATTSVNSLVLNGSATQNALVQSVNSSLQSNATVQSTNTSVLAEANSFVQTLTSYFTTTSDVPSRLTFLSAQYSLLSSGCRYLLDSITIVVSGVLSMDFADLITAAHYCANNGCGNITAGPASETWPETCIVDVAYNISDIELVANTFYNSLTFPANSAFKTYKNAITNCVRNTTATRAQALSCARYQANGYAGTYQASWRSMQFYCVLEETSTMVRYSTVGDLINENP